VTVKDSDRYLLFDDEMRLAGWQNVKTGEVKSPYLPDFDPSAYHRYSFTGIHILSPSVLPLMASWPDRFSIIDFYLSLAASGRIKAVLAPPDFRLIDIGTPEALKEAEKYC
jgi:NDP-sugar pyrophosphorylase family protein